MIAPYIRPIRAEDEDEVRFGRARVLALEAENAGLRVALKAYQTDTELEKDLAAKADAVSTGCARLVEYEIAVSSGLGEKTERLEAVAREIRVRRW